MSAGPFPFSALRGKGQQKVTVEPTLAAKLKPRGPTRRGYGIDLLLPSYAALVDNVDV